jgi:5-methylthioadenosine/S-adenosylhomocysteine deaminase
MLNDPWEGMRTMLAALRGEAGDHRAMTSLEALETATAGAAAAIGLVDRVGRLAVGWDADVILVDLDRPHLQPFYAEPASLVWYAQAQDVVASVVRGRVVMEERRVLGLNTAAALAAAKARTPHLAALMRSVGGSARVAACPCGAH